MALAVINTYIATREQHNPVLSHSRVKSYSTIIPQQATQLRRSTVASHVRSKCNFCVGATGFAGPLFAIRPAISQIAASTERHYFCVIDNELRGISAGIFAFPFAEGRRKVHLSDVSSRRFNLAIYVTNLLPNYMQGIFDLTVQFRFISRIDAHS